MGCNIKNPLLPFEAEIIELVVGPKILKLFTMEVNGKLDPPTSKKNLLDRFRKYYNCSVSSPTFDRWLEVANIEVGHHFGLLKPPPHGTPTAQKLPPFTDLDIMRKLPPTDSSPQEMIDAFLETQHP